MKNNIWITAALCLTTAFSAVACSSAPIDPGVAGEDEGALSAPPETTSTPAAVTAATGEFCGGLANVRCAPDKVCVDDPTDSCDPSAGGRDCGGVCVKRCGGIQGLQCARNEVCVDDPSDSCDPSTGGADCGGTCEPIRCGGIAGLRCPDGSKCVDDPTDSCNPRRGGRDCIGFCK